MAARARLWRELRGCGEPLMAIAAEVCVYTNDRLTVEALDAAA